MSGTPTTQPVEATPWTNDQWSSLLRSGLKVIGTILTTLGVVDASQGAMIAGPVVDAVMAFVGAAATLVGMFKSFWHHSPV